MIILTLLFIKHFIADFLLQTEYQLKHKGTYLHEGGLLHAAIHGVGTFIIVYMFSTGIEVPFFFAMFDALVHYHIDWAKVKINTRLNLSPDYNKGFWWLFGLDQLLHSLTYIVIAALVS